MCILNSLVLVSLHPYTILFLCVHIGIPIRTTLDNATTVQYASLIQQLTTKARSTVRDLDPTNDLCFLRVRTQKHEIMIAPGEYAQTVARVIIKLVRMILC